MEGLNEVNLIGSVAKEVELKHFENDKKVARILLATSKSYKKQNGEKGEERERKKRDNIEIIQRCRRASMPTYRELVIQSYRKKK